MKSWKKSSLLLLLMFAPAFAQAYGIRVCWTPPTKYEDGGVLTDLSGYRIEYGIGNFSRAIVLTSPGLSCYTIENIPAGRYQIRVVALTTAHGESNPSNTATTYLRPAKPTDGAIEAPRDGAIEPKK